LQHIVLYGDNDHLDAIREKSLTDEILVATCL